MNSLPALSQAQSSLAEVLSHGFSRSKRLGQCGGSFWTAGPEELGALPRLGHSKDRAQAAQVQPKPPGG